jgi:pimeloyl-ACP methyl ester carboxylesterase
MVAGAAAAVGLAGGVAAVAVDLRRWRGAPDPAVNDDFEEPPGIVHHTFPTYDGGEIHVVERGSGRTFLLLHGVTVSTEVWHYQLLDLVAAGYRVVAMDIRGHGKSAAGDEGYTVAAMAEDVFTAIRALDLHDTVAVGHSMGAMVLLQLLADHPELVADGTLPSIALVATSASPVLGNGVPAAAAAMVRALTPAAGRGHLRMIGSRVPPGQSPGDLAALYCRLAFGSHPSPTHVELLRSMASAMPAPVLGELLATLLELNVRQVLPAIAVPALVVVGTRDVLTPLRHSRYLARHLPVAELHVLPGCGHMVMLERRQELARLLLDFAARSAPIAQPGPATQR